MFVWLYVFVVCGSLSICTEVTARIHILIHINSDHVAARANYFNQTTTTTTTMTFSATDLSTKKPILFLGLNSLRWCGRHSINSFDLPFCREWDLNRLKIDVTPPSFFVYVCLADELEWEWCSEAGYDPRGKAFRELKETWKRFYTRLLWNVFFISFTRWDSLGYWKSWRILGANELNEEKICNGSCELYSHKEGTFGRQIHIDTFVKIQVNYK